jgi:hypothetical protein
LRSVTFDFSASSPLQPFLYNLSSTREGIGRNLFGNREVDNLFSSLARLSCESKAEAPGTRTFDSALYCLEIENWGKGRESLPNELVRVNRTKLSSISPLQLRLITPRHRDSQGPQVYKTIIVAMANADHQFNLHYRIINLYLLAELVL